MSDPSLQPPQPASGPSDASSSTSPPLPWAFIDCPTDTLIILISHMLNLLIQHNDQVVLTPDALTRFHSRAPPGISVIEYLRRIVKYTNMEKIPLLSLLSYIDTTCQALPTFTLSSLTVHRFLISGVCAGSKAQCDVFCTNAHYAKVGGIKTGELNALEREFLRVTGWTLCCNADLLQRYYTSLIRSHGGYTQAPAPETSPFMPFPHSVSKPSTPSSSSSSLPEAEAEADGEGLTTGNGGEDDDMLGDSTDDVVGASHDGVIPTEANEESGQMDRSPRGEEERVKKSRRKDTRSGSDPAGRERSRSGSSSRRRRTDHVPGVSGPQIIDLSTSTSQQETTNGHAASDSRYRIGAKSVQHEDASHPMSHTFEPRNSTQTPMEIDPKIQFSPSTSRSSQRSSQSIPYSPNSAPHSTLLRPSSTSTANHSPGQLSTSQNSDSSSSFERQPQTRSRALSMTSSAKLAEPRVDTSSAAGMGAPWSSSPSSQATAIIDTDSPIEEEHSHHPKMLRNLVGGIFRRKTHSGSRGHTGGTREDTDDGRGREGDSRLEGRTVEGLIG